MINRKNTLPDDLTEISLQAIKDCYGYLLSDSRWLKGLQPFDECEKHREILIDKYILIDKSSIIEENEVNYERQLQTK